MKIFILAIYTILIIISFVYMLRSYVKNVALKKYNKLIQDNEFVKAIEILQTDEGRMLFGWEHDNIIVYLYFISNDYNNYIKEKESYTPMDFEKKPEIYLRIVYLFKITGLIYMYLQDETEQANNAYMELIKKDDEVDKKLYNLDYKTWELFQVLKMIYAYHSINYKEAKRMYECISTYAYNHTVKTLISYYMCKIYEIEEDTDSINAIINDPDIMHNPYGIYLEQWRAKQ